MDAQHHLQRNRRTTSFTGRLVIHGRNQGQKRLLGNRDLHLIQEALATRPLFGVDLLAVREAQLEGGGHPFQSQFWIWIDFSEFFRCFLIVILWTLNSMVKTDFSSSKSKMPLNIYTETVAESVRNKNRIRPTPDRQEECESFTPLWLGAVLQAIVQ
ncbi:hypothetical protein [Synechococcus sp. RedBA-s]|uniref:hypothetical protein n=1 Tax=Synechococcus sp. RedBA-s TaxID=2823741 RepID=UPI0020CE2D35|nr:hypothetical protein [Synechococcus sp. RedBA-s]